MENAKACDERKNFRFSCQKHTFIINFFPKLASPFQRVPLLFVKRGTEEFILTIVFYLIMLATQLCVYLPTAFTITLWIVLWMEMKNARGASGSDKKTQTLNECGKIEEIFTAQSTTQRRKSIVKKDVENSPTIVISKCLFWLRFAPFSRRRKKKINSRSINSTIFAFSSFITFDTHLNN